MATARIKLLRNKREAQVRQMRRDVAMLLESGRDETARIRVRTLRSHPPSRFLLLLVLRSGSCGCRMDPRFGVLLRLLGFVKEEWDGFHLQQEQQVLCYDIELVLDKCFRQQIGITNISMAIGFY